MPVYEYECGNCNGLFEVSQKFSDPVLTSCTLCKQAGKVRKLLSRSSFVLKGSGWYATDYANKETKETAASDKPCTETKPSVGCPSGPCAGSCAAKG